MPRTLDSGFRRNDDGGREPAQCNALAERLRSQNDRDENAGAATPAFLSGGNAVAAEDRCKG